LRGCIKKELSSSKPDLRKISALIVAQFLAKLKATMMMMMDGWMMMVMKIIMMIMVSLAMAH
jgi:hypothetical protein